MAFFMIQKRSEVDPDCSTGAKLNDNQLDSGGKRIQWHRHLEISLEPKMRH